MLPPTAASSSSPAAVVSGMVCHSGVGWPGFSCNTVPALKRSNSNFLIVAPGKFICPIISFHAPASIVWAHYAMMTVVCLSVCQSVSCLTPGREQKGIESWKLAGRKPMTRVTPDPIYRSKVKVTRQLILGQKISRIFGMGRPMNSELGIIIIIIITSISNAP